MAYIIGRLYVTSGSRRVGTRGLLNLDRCFSEIRAYKNENVNDEPDDSKLVMMIQKLYLVKANSGVYSAELQPKAELRDPRRLRQSASRAPGRTSFPLRRPFLSELIRKAAR